MSRDATIRHATDHFDSGAFRDTLARRLAIPTESQNPERAAELERYLADEMMPELEALGFATEILHHEKATGPFLIAERIEDGALPTVLGYGHGDVVRGQDEMWDEGLSPWTLNERSGRWYGRGVADNKGQHCANIAALRAVLETNGRLGFNAKYLIEMGEEVGSPGLREFCADHRDRLAADALIASDGPRLTAERPTLFLGSRGGVNFDLWIDAREGGRHSGNWGGLLSNPAVQLAHAIATLVGPTGQIRIPEMVPHDVPEAVRRVLADCDVTAGPEGAEIEADWGEPGLTPSERVFGWCALEVLAFEAGTPKAPVNAIPPRAWARLQLRFVVDVDPFAVIPAVRRHLDRHGLGMVEVALSKEAIFEATRLDPDDPWVSWAATSMSETTGKRTAILPNLGGSLPNDAFSAILGMRTIWVPHSYPGCSQHAPNEHLPPEIIREGLAIMAGLYHDLGHAPPPR